MQTLRRIAAILRSLYRFTRAVARFLRGAFWALVTAAIVLEDAITHTRSRSYARQWDQDQEAAAEPAAVEEEVPSLAEEATA